MGTKSSKYETPNISIANIDQVLGQPVKFRFDTVSDTAKSAIDSLQAICTERGMPDIMYDSMNETYFCGIFRDERLSLHNKRLFYNPVFLYENQETNEVIAHLWWMPTLKSI